MDWIKMFADHMMNQIATIWYVKAYYGPYYFDKINIMVHKYLLRTGMMKLLVLYGA